MVRDRAALFSQTGGLLRIAVASMESLALAFQAFVPLFWNVVFHFSSQELFLVILKFD